MIEIDCSVGEGGGQVTRTSLTLAALTQKPVKLFNIRAKRPNPGLAMQHLTGAKAVRSICRGDLEGAELGSKELIFKPGKIVGGKYEFNIGTAGSVTLVAQTILPILLNAEKKSIIRIKGGTHVFKSPTYDYFEHVFLKALKRMGANISSRILKTGYYPKGGGEIELIVEPSKLEPIKNFIKSETKAIIRLGSLPTHIGVREKKILVQNGFELEDIHTIEEKTLSPGNSVFIFNDLIGVDVLGAKGKRAEDVAQEALSKFKDQETYNVDYWLADQLSLYYSLIGKGEYSFSKVTNHLKTNVEIIQKFLNAENRKKLGFSTEVNAVHSDVKIKLENNSISFH